MPLAEVHAIRGAFSHNELKVLGSKLTEIFMYHQGAKPDSKAAASITCIEVTEVDPSLVFVAGEPTKGPRIRVIYTVPSGSLNEDTKASLVKETTGLVLELQGRTDPEPYDIWCIVNEIPDGNWGAAGKIFRWRDIIRWVVRRDIAARRAQQQVQAARVSAE